MRKGISLSIVSIALLGIAYLVRPAWAFTGTSTGTATSGPGSGTVTSVTGTTNQIGVTNGTTTPGLSITGLSGVTGPIRVTGNSGTGDFITNVNVNGAVNVQAYGATGNITPITCTSTGATTLTGCSSLTGWSSGTNNYAFIIGGGTANALSTPAAPTVTPSTTGTGCPGGATHTYTYEITACKNNTDGASCTTSSTASTPTSAEAICPGAANFTKNTLSAYTVASATFYNIYRSIDSGPFNKLDETASTTYADEGQPADDQLALALDDSATAPASARAATYTSNITGVNSGAGTITLNVAPTQTGTLTLYHDDSEAILAAKNAVIAQGGGTLYFPAGIYPVWPITTAGFGGQADALISLVGTADSNIQVLGAGPQATTLRVASMLTRDFAQVNVFFQMYGPTASGNNYGGLAGTNLSATVNAGDISDAVASVSGFNVGDHVLVRSGQNDAGTTGQPTAEIVQVAAIDATNNVLTWVYPVSRLYQQEYYQTGTTGVTAAAPLWTAAGAQAIYTTNNLITCATNCPSAVATIFKATTVTLGGNVGSSEPNWNSSCPSATNTCTDGNVTWTNLGTAAAQAAIFQAVDVEANLIHDVQVRDLATIGPPGGVSSLSGMRLFNIAGTDRILFKNLVARQQDIGAIGFDHDTTLSDSTIFYERTQNASACCGATGVSQFFIDHNVFNALQGLAFQMGEGSEGIRFTNNVVREGFPVIGQVAAVIAGTYDYDITIANNLFYGHAGAGIVQIGIAGSKASQMVNIYGNTMEAPWPASIPDSFSRNKGGVSIVQDPGSSRIDGNAFYPAASWDDFALTGTIGYGNSNTGQNRTIRTCTGTIKFSQATTTTNLPICTVPSNTTLLGCTFKSSTAFNAATTNVLSIGGSSSAQTYVNNTSISGTPQIALTLNTAAGLIATAPSNAANNLTAYYSFTGTAPTTGIGVVNCQYTTEGQ